MLFVRMIFIFVIFDALSTVHGMEYKADSIHTRYPLSDAVYKNNKELVEKLIAQGEDINERYSTTYAYTPLHYAAADLNLEIIKFLLDHGANTTLKTYPNANPFYIVKARLKDSHENPEKVFAAKSMLFKSAFLYGEMYSTAEIDDFYELDPLHKAAIKGNLDVFKQSLKGHEDELDKKDELGATLLMYAVAGGHVSLVEFLIEQKVDLLLAKADNGNSIFDIIQQCKAYVDAYDKEKGKLSHSYCEALREANQKVMGLCSKQYRKQLNQVLKALCMSIKKQHNKSIPYDIIKNFLIPLIAISIPIQKH